MHLHVTTNESPYKNIFDSKTVTNNKIDLQNAWLCRSFTESVHDWMNRLTKQCRSLEKFNSFESAEFIYT